MESEICFAHPRATVLYATRRDFKNIKTRVTIAYRIVGDKVEYACAFCAPTDNFSRPLGRKIAQNRLEKLPRTITPLVLDDAYKTIMGDIMAGELPWRWKSAVLEFNASR